MSGRRVLITGAGSGLGRELARCYAERGDRVACVDMYADRAQETCKLLTGGGHMALVADVGSDAAMAALKGQVMGAWGGLDVLVNNAGIACGGECAHVSAAEWQRTLNINLMGVGRGVREFVPMMEPEGNGLVINVASFAGLAGAPGLGAYGVSKAAVVALSEGMRAELIGKGIVVSVSARASSRPICWTLSRGACDAPMKHMVAKLMEKSPDQRQRCCALHGRAAETNVVVSCYCRTGHPHPLAARALLLGLYFKELPEVRGQERLQGRRSERRSSDLGRRARKRYPAILAWIR
ncbi:MAG: SDR family NAD(P)-dependent oxidoreductase [Rhodanobacteraceae bacterium]|nr:SDR family NAD(P)-dependent oxidoreductase [Rhodanobacteraceae bacterium]